MAHEKCNQRICLDGNRDSCPPFLGVHETHCCSKHGCKYGNPNCPVKRGVIVQEFPCEWCSDEDEHDQNHADVVWYEAEIRLYGQQHWKKTTQYVGGIGDGFPTEEEVYTKLIDPLSKCDDTLYSGADWRVVRCTRTALPVRSNRRK